MSVERDIEAARALFEKAERETIPELKARALEEATSLLASCDPDEVSDADANLIANLRMAHTRRLLTQLVRLSSISMDPDIRVQREVTAAELAANSRLPAIYYSTDFVEDGGLMSYGVTITDLFRRAASYVDRIIKGAKPADLPVEQPTKVPLVINLKAAKRIGLTIQPSLLLRADRVIE